MQIMVAKDSEELAAYAADCVAEVVCEKPGCTLGFDVFPDGVDVYGQLSARYVEEALDFSRVAAFGVTESRVGRNDGGDDEAYPVRARLDAELFGTTNIHFENVCTPGGAAADPHAVCAAFEAQIRLQGGIDTLILALGPNGELGANVPGDSFSNETCYNEERGEFTMGIGTVMEARRIVVVASGAAYADIVNQAFYGPITPKVPASILQFHPNAIAVLDDAAFSACDAAQELEEQERHHHHHGEN